MAHERMLTYDDLVNDMAAGCKPKQDWKIGIEHEQFVFSRIDGAALSYDGSSGIAAILDSMAKNYGWKRLLSGGHVVALERRGDSVTLEPGGQVEFSGAPQVNLAAVRAAAESFYAELSMVCDSLGVGVLAVGFHPHWRRDQIHLMPKPRYEIMRPYMEKKGRFGVDMMLRTCGAQVNMDFADEGDMVKKYRVALGVQPVITALMANSSMVEGKDSGYQSYRSLMWTDTDADRCGVPEFVFGPSMGFSRYVDYALDVPMYFIIRDGRYINLAGQSFRAFMDGRLDGHEGEYPTIDDWRDHLTTLFPEVRLKRYIELRGPDSAPPHDVYAMAAFWTGILYDPDALDQAWDLMRAWPASQHTHLRMDVVKDGLRAALPAYGVLANFARVVLDIARDGLLRQADNASFADDLSVFRDRLDVPTAG